MNTLSEQTHPSDIGKDAGQVLGQDLQTVIADVQSLLHATASQGGEALDEIRANITRSIESIKKNLQESEAQVLAGSKAVLKASDEYVHVHPWQTIGMAAALGFALAWAIKR